VANDLETRFQELRNDYKGKLSDYRIADQMVYRTVINNIRDSEQPAAETYTSVINRLRKQRTELEAALQKLQR
jgi:hypothetical protein